MPTWEQLQARVSYPLVRPSWVVRPAPPPPVPDPNDEDESGSEEEASPQTKGKPPPTPLLRREVMLPIFSKLTTKELLVVMRVCRQWGEWAIDPSLWRRLSLAKRHVDDLRLMGVVRRQPSVLSLDWSTISYEQFSWLLCRLPQLQSLHCVGLSWGVLRPLLSPYCPSLCELELSYCEGVDDDILCSLLRSPPFNRPGYRDTTSRLQQLVRLKLAGTQIGDSSVAIIAHSLPFLTHLDLSGCLRLTTHTPELLSHSASVVSHSLTNLDLRGCHRMTPLVLPSLAKLPLLSHLALDPCHFIPLKAIKVWGESHGYSFDAENVMRRTPPLANPMQMEEGVSDCEMDSIPRRKAPSTVDERKETLPSKKGQQTEDATKNNDKKHDKENLTGVDGRPKMSEYKTGKKQSDDKQCKPSKKENKKESNKEESEVKKVTKLSREKDPKQPTKGVGSKKETPQVVITPLDKGSKGPRSNRPDDKRETAPKTAETGTEAKGSTKVYCTSAAESQDIPSEEKTSSESCRRSERSNKGRKYKLNFAKKRNVRNKLKRRETFRKGEKVSLKEEEGTALKKEGRKVSFKSPGFRKKHLKKSLVSDFKRKVRKNIMTRSKRQTHDKGNRMKQEYEVVQQPLQKSSKEVCRSQKEGQVPGLKSAEAEDSLKVRISLKSGPQYASKLRKKSRDEESSSPTSSPESKRNPSTGKDDSKILQPKKQEEFTSSTPACTKKAKDQKEILRPTEEIQSSSSAFLKKRKERTGSSSSCSSSPSSSPCLPLSKRLKVELEPITKIGRRRSDSQKPPGSGATSVSGSSKDSNTTSSTSSANTATDKSSSRERPERHHRSPRRLSMCQ